MINYSTDYLPNYLLYSKCLHVHVELYFLVTKRTYRVETRTLEEAIGSVV